MITDPLNPSKFAADCQDILITGLQESKTFTLLKDNAPILNETYNYDADGSIRITGLAKLLSQSLYGELKEGAQTHATAIFDFQIDGVTVFHKSIYAMRLQNPRDPNGEKEILTAAPDGVCYPGHPLLLTVIGQKTIRLSRREGTIATATIGTEGVVTTVDCDPAQIFPNQYRRATYMDIGSEIERRIIPQPCDGMVTVRFLNRYDMPECVTARYMTEKPTAQDDVSMMYGRKIRFGVQSATEYSIFSDRLTFKDQYDTWQDMLTSRKAQLLWHGQWIDIIITKSNYTRQRRDFYGSQIEISFQTANPYMTL